MNNGFAIAIEPRFFRTRPEFDAAINYLFNSIKEAPAAQGSKGALTHGEPESIRNSIRAREGILVDDNTLTQKGCRATLRCIKPNVVVILGVGR
jgi:LDH2 family malate/lactate/ureidoglycolate dehydrogenase